MKIIYIPSSPVTRQETAFFDSTKTGELINRCGDYWKPVLEHILYLGVVAAWIYSCTLNLIICTLVLEPVVEHLFLYIVLWFDDYLEEEKQVK